MRCGLEGQRTSRTDRGRIGSENDKPDEQIKGPTHIKEANAFITKYHRHSLSTVGGKFAVGAIEKGKLVGVAIADRPVARRVDDGKTTEVLRICTAGTPNCCSFLYARVARIARLFGYTKIITYTLEEESGASLRAVGGRVVGRVEARQWSALSRPRKSQAVYLKANLRWEL